MNSFCNIAVISIALKHYSCTVIKPSATVPRRLGQPPNKTSGISPAEEKAIARELSPTVAWPTLILALVLPLSFLSLIYLGYSRKLPLVPSTILLTLVSYMHYTLVHESIHGNLVPGHPRLRRVNELVGWIGSTGMAMAWPFLKRTHMKHHSHTNSEHDPDLIVKGSLLRLLVTWVILTAMFLIPLPLLKYVSPTKYDRIKGALVGTESWQMAGVACFALTLLAAAILTGHFVDWLCLWFLPTKFAMLILHISFQWLPHYPFDRTERYLNTRISLWVGGTVLTLQQNLHLMHHLWPSVPFYNYARLYRRLRPVLHQKGARIEGLIVGPHARDKRSSGLA